MENKKIKINLKKRLTGRFFYAILNIDNTDNTDKEKKIGVRFGGKRNVFENIVEEIKNLISVGALKGGDKLPSVRGYAVERKINPNTVAKAYTVLEEEGLIEVQPKKGAYVIGEQEEKDEFDKLKSQIKVWKTAGITQEEIVEAVKAVYEVGKERTV